MEIINKVELKLKDFDQCSFVCSSDMPLGKLYDFACALKHFISEKVKEHDKVENPDIECEEQAS